MTEPDEAAREALSDEVALACDAAGVVTWRDARAARRLGLEVGAALHALAVTGTSAKVAALVRNASRETVRNWELALMVGGANALLTFRGAPWEGGALLVGSFAHDAHTRTLDRVSSALSEIAALHRETERQQRALVEAHAGLEATARRDAWLAAFGAELFATSPLDEVVGRALALTAPQFADWAAVYAGTGDAPMTRLASAHGDPARDRFDAAPWTLAPPSPALAHTLRAGATESYGPAGIASLAGDEGQRWFEALGTAHLVVAPLVARGRAVGMLLLGAGRAREATAAGAFEEAARLLALALDHDRLRRDAASATRARDDFLATTSAELRAPTQVMFGALRRLRAAEGDPTRRGAALSDLEGAVELLAGHVDALLEVAAVLRGRVTLRRRAAEVAALVVDACATVGAEAAARRVTLALPRDAGDGCPVSCDPDQLAQATRALLRHAVSVTAEGGVVDVRLRPDAARCGFEVTVPSRAAGAISLGLVVARSLFELHGGELAESVGPSLRYVATVPREVAARGDAQALLGALASRGGVSG